MANFLIKNFSSLKKAMTAFKSAEDLENKFEDLVDTGRIINNCVFRHLVRLKEEFLALILVQFDCFLHEESLHYIIKYDMKKLLR